MHPRLPIPVVGLLITTAACNKDPGQPTDSLTGAEASVTGMEVTSAALTSTADGTASASVTGAIASVSGTETGAVGSISGTDGTSTTLVSTADETAPASDESYDYPDPTPRCGDDVCGPDEICVWPPEDCVLGRPEVCGGSSSSSSSDTASDESCWTLVDVPSLCKPIPADCDRNAPDFDSCLQESNLCPCSPHHFGCGLVNEFHFDCGDLYCYPYYGYCDDDCY